MATLGTKFLWDIEGKAETGGIPGIITAGEIFFRPVDHQHKYYDFGGTGFGNWNGSG